MAWTFGNLREIGALYRREVRGALRERSIVINSVLIPLVLYPAILWLMFQGIAFVQGMSEGAESRVAVLDVPEAQAAIRDSLAAMDRVRMEPFTGTADSASRAVRSGELDAVIEFLPVAGPAASVPGNFRAEIVYDRSEDRSRRARDRAEEVLRSYRERWLPDQAGALGISAAELEGFRISDRDVATGRQIATLLLSQMVPVFLVVVVALGCFFPAIDATAGERERSTWETLMTVSASRSSIVTAKYLYVASFGTAAAILNVVAMTITLGPVLKPMLGQTKNLSFHVPLTAVPVMLGAAVGLALFFAAAMMILASFAQTFKEGQAMITPVYWLILVPLLVGNSTDVHLTAKWAVIPIANVVLMTRDALTGIIEWPLVGLTLAVEAAVVVLCLWLARQVLGFEDLVLGSYDGSFWTFVRSRLLKRPRRAEAGGKG